MPNQSNIPTNSFVAHRFQIQQTNSRPNILLLMTDQQRFDTIHSAGYDFMHTPNLDRLVEEGCLYRYGYSPNPICLAARHNLITGLTARHHQFPDNVHNISTRSDLPTLPRILSDNGYETRSIGKMHFIPARRHNGFDKMELMEELPNYREQDEYAMYLKEVGLGHIQNIHGVRNLLYMLPQRSIVPEEHHGTFWVGQQTADYIRTNNGRHPFFLWSSWIAPHPPFDVIDRFADMYRDVDLPEPHISNTPLAALTEENRMLGDLPTDDYVRRMREVYYASISMIDESIGEVLTALEETNQLDNTVIIFVSDHGEFLGDYGLYQKWNPYDCCSRIPFIIRYPERLKPGSVNEEFVDLNDILPTVLDVAGLDYPGAIELPGESLFAQNPQKDRDWQYLEYAQGNRRWISIRDQSYKFNYYYGGGFEQLFDMQNDPNETTNLLTGEVTPDLKIVRNNHYQKLVEYEEKYGLEGYVDDNGLKVGDPYQPHPQRNEAFPRFPLKLTDDHEKASIQTLYEEIQIAIKDEPVVKLAELDMKAWQKNLNVPNDTVQHLLEHDMKRHQKLSSEE
jgi:arylsulfatase